MDREAYVRRIFAFTCSTFLLSSAIVADAKSPIRAGLHIAKSSPHRVPAEGTLDREDLIEIAKIGASAADDEFSDDPTLSFVGRNFAITVDPENLSVSYDKSSHALKVETGRYIDAFDLQSRKTQTFEMGQNGYGARTRITKTRGSIFGIWLPGHSYSRDPIVFNGIFEPQAAKSLSGAVRLCIYGHITKSDGVYARKESAIYEKDYISSATISDPEDMWLRGYYVSAAFDRAEWFDNRTGVILQKTEFKP